MEKTAKTGWEKPYDELTPWTVMLYMVAGNTAELDAFAVRNLREMENGVNDHARVAVQINRAWPDTPQRYEIRPKGSTGDQLNRAREGESVLVDPDEVVGANMGDPDTLTGFLQWAVKKYPAQHYLLVLWEHAYGLGFGRDHNDALTLPDLRCALKAFREQRAECSGKSDAGPLEILGTNACAMSYAEAAYELKASAEFLVASQISVPFSGWPYDAILRKITPSMSPKTLCRIIVNSYTSRLNTPLTGERVEMTILSLKKATGLKAAIHELAEALEEELLRPDDQLLAVRDAFLGTVSGDVRPLIDLRALLKSLLSLRSTKVTKASGHVGSVLTKLIVPATVAGEKPAEKPASTPSPAPPAPPAPPASLADADLWTVDPVCGPGGVGIFAPFVTDEGDLKRLELDDRTPETRRRGRLEKPALTGKETYFGLALFEGKQTWPHLVYNGLRQEIPEELLAFIGSVGVTSQSDRIGIAQIIISIESWFNKFDRVLDEAQERIIAELKTTFAAGATSAVHDTTSPTNGVSGGDHVFGPPSLRLVSPIQIVEKTRALRAVKAIRTGAGAISDRESAIIAGFDPGAIVASNDAAAYPPTTSVTSPLVVTTIGWFVRVERALEGIERATTTGLTNATFGLGPVGSDGTGFGGGPERPKGNKFGGGGGPERPKGNKFGGGGGPERPKGNKFDADDPGGDQGAAAVEVGSGLEQVAALYRQVAEAMQQLEQDVSALESAAAAALTVEGMGEGLDADSRSKVISRELNRSFGILREGASNARRTVRRVVAHPVFGLGPGPVPFAQDAREELAVRNGLGRRDLELLS